MSKFSCSVCGYTYDEAVGLPEKGIKPGTKWDEVPHDFKCPLCGAPKEVFEEVQEKVETPAPVVSEEENYEDLRELSAGELSALCSNLAKGCEKQQLTQEMDLLNQLADYYRNKVVAQNSKDFEDLSKLLNSDFSEGFAKANAIAAGKADRGALRALVWSEKVSRMIKSLLDRYSKEGEAMLANTNIYVCDICGFVYMGDKLPEVCPVCKVPNFKITQIGRR